MLTEEIYCLFLWSLMLLVLLLCLIACHWAALSRWKCQTLYLLCKKICMLFFPQSILLCKFTPGNLTVCEKGILQRGIFKLKWGILTLSSYRASSVSWRKWKLLDVMPRRALRDSVSLCTSPSATLPIFSDGTTERRCLKCASTLKSHKVKAASAHLSQVLAASTHS